MMGGCCNHHRKKLSCLRASVVAVWQVLDMTAEMANRWDSSGNGCCMDQLEVSLKPIAEEDCIRERCKEDLDPSGNPVLMHSTEIRRSPLYVGFRTGEMQTWANTDRGGN